MILVLFLFGIASYLLLRMTADKKALFYAIGLIFQIGWIIAYIIAAFSPNLEDKIFWDTRIILCLFGILISYLLFSAEFNGFHYFEHKKLYFFVIIFSILQLVPVFIYTDHPFFRYNYNIWIIDENFTLLVNDVGLYLRAIVVESFLISLFPIGLFARNLFLKSRSHLIKKQSILIIGSYFIIIFQFIIFIWGIQLGFFRYSIEINLVLFAFANILIFIAVGPLQMFELLPAANKIIIKNIGDGYCIFNNKDSLLDLNKELMNILGVMNKTEVIGKTPSKIFIQHPALSKFAQSESEERREISLSLWDGIAYFEVKRVNFYRLKRYVGFIIIFHDITARKEYEQNLKDSKEDLEQKYQHAQKLDSVGRLAGGIAHEFNYLLTIILGNAELIELKNRVDHEDKALLREISDAANNASRLTKQLLAIGRKNVIHLKHIDVNQRLEELKEIFHRLIGNDSDITIKLDLDPQCGNIYVDMGLFDQILVNLVLNARDAMPLGGLLEISTYHLKITDDNKHHYPNVKESNTEYSCISIKDSGVGMNEEVKKHLFEPFFTTKERGEGTGLGLSMAYGAVKQFNGFLKVDSKEGVGSSFLLGIPTSNTSEIQSVRISDKQIQRGDRELILVVEDDTAVRSTTIGMLKRLNYEVVSFGNGYEAIKFFKKHNNKINLLFTDIVMKGIKGNELANELKKLDPNMKVLFVSGYTDKVIAKYGILYKDTHFIAKPFSFEMLAEKIYEILHT